MTPRRRHPSGGTSSGGSDSGSSGTPKRPSSGTGRTGVDVSTDGIDTMAGRLRETGGRVDAVGTTLGGINVGPQSMGIVGGSFTGAAQSHVTTAKQHVTRTREAVQHAEDGTRTTAQSYRDTEATNAANLGNIQTDTDIPTTTRDTGATTPSAATTPTTGPVDTPPATRDPGDTTTPSTTESPNRPNRPEDTRTPEDERVCENDPIDVASGEMVLAHDDVELPGVLPLVLRRTHISSYRAGVSFGPSWAATVDQRLELDARGVVFLADDGMILVYPHPPEHGAVLPETGPRWPLSRTDTGYAIEPRGAGTTLHFAAAERGCHLAAVTDRNANRIDFDRDAAGTLTAVRHSGGYHLDVVREDGRLAELRLREADVAVVRYRHDGEGRLGEVVNSSGLPLRFDYDSAHRVTKWTDRNGEWYGYVYDADGRCVANHGSGGFLDGSFSYADGTTRFTDALGNVTIYRFDDRRRVIARTDPLGHTVTQEWDDADHVVARTDALGHTTRFTYDAAGNLVTTTRPDGTQSLAEYDGEGRITTFVGPDGGVWRQEYDARGNLAGETDPDGSVRRFRHDERGRRVAVTDALGNVRRIETNEAGVPVAVTDPTGATTRYTRDPFGRAVTVTDPLGRATRFSWTVEGRLLSRTRPDGATERWRYDAEGNEVSYVDPMGRVSSTRTTHFNLPVEETRPDGSTFRYVYDRTLRLSSVVDAGGREWRYTYDAAGNVVREVDFNGRELAYSYDAADRLVERVNGTGQAIGFTRDALGRIVARRSADDLTTLEYDPAGRLMRARNNDADLSYTRDALGRVLTETVNGRTVASVYDRLGRRVGRRTPTGTESRWGYDAGSRPVNLAVGTRALSFGYDAAGQEVSREFGGVVLAQTWDANQRLIAQAMTGAAGPVVRRGYRYQPDDNLAEVDDLVTGRRRYQTDQLGRVTSVDRGAWSERYAYDASGNIASDGASYEGTLVRTARDAHYEHDRQGRVVLRRRTRLSRKPDLWRYQWNSDDRLVAATTPDGQRWTYQYDPLGRRIAKQRLAADGSVAERVDFTWDGSVLAEQTHASGRTTSWEFDATSFRPLTQLERVRGADQTWVDERFYAIVTDLVGTPTELVDELGEVAWRHGSTLWGEPLTGPRHRADTPLRFPGQYFDAETGLHYNYLRHYDPVAGRYLSPDPLGLFGGPSPHAYVHNPTGWTDALGLTAESGGPEMMDPNDINFSQRSVTENSYAEVMANGDWRWNESPVHVMEVNGQLVSYDNRRLDAAREAGVPVGVVRVDPNAPHPESTTGKTWAEKFRERYRDPRNRGPNGEPVPDTGLPDRPQALPPGCGGGRRRRRGRR
jgi:RHS repeat-associated protein